LPVSSSSSFSRQQRAQPSHRLSHSALDISSNVLVFQKNPSWAEVRLGGAVMKSAGLRVGFGCSPSRRSGNWDASGLTTDAKEGGNTLELTTKMVSQSIRL